jgi:hypothetical protein
VVFTLYDQETPFYAVTVNSSSSPPAHSKLSAAKTE